MRISRKLFLLGMLGLIATGAAAADKINTRTAYPVFKRSDRGNQRRIPAITTVGGNGKHAGRLVAIYDNRPSNGDIGGGNLGLEVAYSDDNGKTWSTPDYGKTADGKYATKWRDECSTSVTSLATMQKDADKYWDCAFGDAAIVSDRESGSILMMSAAGPINFFNGRRNTNHIQCASWYSHDGGETWTMPLNRTEEILSLFDGEPQFGGIDSQFIGSGRMMQSHYIKVGDYYRVYAVISSQNGGNNTNTRNWVLYTDDFGATWKVLGGIERAAVTSNGDEPKAEELPDGSVLVAARNKAGNRNFNIFRYTDIEKGEGHWDEHITTNMGYGTINATDGEIMILPVVENATKTQCYLALQSFPYGGGRNNVTIAYKAFKEAADIALPSAFTKWDGSLRVSSKASAYSTMTWQNNNTLGFFYEESQTGTYDGVYINFTIEEITDNAYSYQEDKNNEKANALRDELVAFRAENFDNGTTDGYVGQKADLSVHKAKFEDAVEAYRKNPSIETYIALNRAEYCFDYVEIIDGGVYQFISAHQGSYSGVTESGINMDEDVYLASNGTLLTTSQNPESNVTHFVVKKTESGNWTLYNEGTGKYIGRSPAASTPFKVADAPYEYIITSKTSGFTSIVCSDPTTAGYPALRLDSYANIISGSPGAPSSQWYMKLVATESSVNTIVFDKENAGEEIFFDITGRRVKNPSSGLYITNKGRKIIIK